MAARRRPIAVVDKLTGEVLRIYRDAQDAATGEGGNSLRIRKLADNHLLGRGWEAYRYADELRNEDGMRAKKFAPVILSDENIDVAFKTIAAAAKALGMEKTKLQRHLDNGKPFEFEDMEVTGFVPEFASEAFSKVRRYDE